MVGGYLRVKSRRQFRVTLRPEQIALSAVMRHLLPMRYKCWRSRKDTHLHLLCAEGSEAFEVLPVAIRNLGPWTGGPEGEIDKLRLPYRILSTVGHCWPFWPSGMQSFPFHTETGRSRPTRSYSACGSPIALCYCWLPSISSSILSSVRAI